MRSVRLLILTMCALSTAVLAQTVAVDPSINVTPDAGGGVTDTSPPSLYGIAGGGAVEQGQNVQLTVQFYGTGAGQTYQWKKNGNAIAGATMSSYALSAVTDADAGTYTVAVTNSAGSSVATTDLTVKAPAAPVITTQPRSLVVYVNQPATFSVYATGSYPRTYQWRRDGAAIAGATQGTFTVPGVTTADAAAYSVIISNSLGSATSTSASLTVNAAIAPVLYANSPYDVTTTAGNAVTLQASLSSGSSPYTYQWYKNGAAIATGTAAQLTFNPIAVADAGKYSVKVTNTAGSATSREATVTVNPPTPVTFSYGPQSQTLYEGQSLNLNASVNGSYPISYQWQKDGASIVGATYSSYGVSAVSLSDAGSYALVATNAAGAVTSPTAVVTVNPAVAPAITTPPQSQTIAYGGYLNLSVTTTGTTPFQYQWKKNGVPISGATYGNYSLSSAKDTDSGDYTVTISNRAGSVTSTAAKVTVAPPIAPSITTDLSDKTVTEGDSTYLSVAVTGTSPMTFQWYGNGVALPNGTSSSYSFQPKLSDAGTYYVVIKNVAGTVTSRKASLTVNPMPPPAVATLYSQTAVAGRSFSLSTSYYGSGTITYQWYKNGVAIPGATGSSYGVNSASASDAGYYFVVATNSGGSTTSRTAHVDLAQDTTLPPGAWIAAERGGDILYFVFSNPARIERFNIVTESWLSPILLSRTPTAFAVSNSYLFIASGSIVYRYGLDGSGETILNSAFDSNVTGLAIYEPYVIACTSAYSSGTVAVLNPTTGAKISSVSASYYWSPSMAVAPSVSRIFSRTSGISPSDITYVTLAADGTITKSPTDSSYHGDFRDATRVFVSPSQKYVADNGGTVYTAADLKFAGGIGGPFDDLGFTADDQFVMLRGGTIIVYNTGFNETGRVSTGILASRVFIQGANAFAFAYPAPGGSITMAKVALSQAKAPALPAQVDANNVAFTPDATFIDRDGVVWLYSKVNRQLFRWSTAKRAYLPSIPLQGWPDFVTYSSVTHRIYLGYPDTRILQIKLDQGATAEEPFANAPQQVMALATAGEFVFLVDPTGAWCSYYLFAPDGTLKASRDWSYYGAEYVWNPVLRRMYQFRDDTSPNDLLYTEITTAGTFGTQKDSPYHGEIVTQYPIRISPDGGSVLLGSGKFYDANTMYVSNSIGNAIGDAIWVDGKLITGRTTAAGMELQRWGGGNYALDASKTLPGRLVRIFTLGSNQLVVVTERGTVPYYTILDENLNVLSTDAGVPEPRLANLATRGWTGTGDQALIPSFVVSGSKPKLLLIRAAGPALIPFGVSGAVADPQLTVYNNDGSVAVASNDNWGTASNLTELVDATAKVGAFPFASGSKDAAVLVSLPPGSYSVIAKGAGNSTGVALVEMYDVDDPVGSSRVINMGARAQIGTGENVAIPSVVISGNTPKTVLIRAVGPGLSDFGVAGTLSDPKLQLYHGNDLMYQNDNWEQSVGATAAQIANAAAKTGAFVLKPGSLDSALLVTLTPGAYTALVSGANGGSGVALVEVYEVPSN